MLLLFTHSLTLADTITIPIDANLLIYLLIAAVVGIFAEFIVGWRLPFGIVGAIIAGLVGIWLILHVINFTGFSDIVFHGVPLIRSLLGAIILVALWHLVTYRSWSRRRRYYYRR